MSDYIKREDVLNYPLRMGNELFGNNAAFLAGVECVMDYVENPLYVPAADAAPVVHGHWIKTSLMFASSNGNHGNVHVCSNCGEQSGVGFKTPYCAICGAKMDEVTK